MVRFLALLLIPYLHFYWQDGEIIYSDWKLGKDESGQQYSECFYSVFVNRSGIIFLILTVSSFPSH